MDVARFGILVAATVLAASCTSTSNGDAALTTTNREGRPSGNGVVRVPSLVDEPLVLAERELERLGLRAETTKPKDVLECPVDGHCVSGAVLFVSAQDPYAGALVPRDSVVVLDLSRYVGSQSQTARPSS